MKQLYGDRVFIDSVGARKGEVVAFAVAAMAEIGIDMYNHKPKSFEELEDTSFDLVISLSPEAQHKAVELTRTSACDLLFWHTFDATAVHGNRDAILEAFSPGSRHARAAHHRGVRRRRAAAPSRSPRMARDDRERALILAPRARILRRFAITARRADGQRRTSGISRYRFRNYFRTRCFELSSTMNMRFLPTPPARCARTGSAFSPATRSWWR